jgi:hypothetical protein
MVLSLDIISEMARSLNLAPPPRDDPAVVELFLRACQNLYLAVRDGRRPT